MQNIFENVEGKHGQRTFKAVPNLSIAQTDTSLSSWYWKYTLTNSWGRTGTALLFLGDSSEDITE